MESLIARELQNYGESNGATGEVRERVIQDELLQVFAICYVNTGVANSAKSLLTGQLFPLDWTNLITFECSQCYQRPSSEDLLTTPPPQVIIILL